MKRRQSWIAITALVLPCVAPAADPEEGRSLYETHCEVCHAADGRGTVPGVPDFGRGQGLLSPDGAIARKIRSGGGGMPAYEGLLREQQLLDVIAYVRSFQR